MAIRERIKKAIARRRSSLASPSSSTSSSNPSDRSVYYQPGEKIPYKYLRPVEPAHQKNLDSFSFTDAWRRNKSISSQYSPMGSRMPSRRNSLVMSALGGRLSFSKNRGSTTTIAKAEEESAMMTTSNLTPIESVPITRMEPVDSVEATPEPFSQKELDKALKNARSQ